MPTQAKSNSVSAMAHGEPRPDQWNDFDLQDLQGLKNFVGSGHVSNQASLTVGKNTTWETGSFPANGSGNISVGSTYLHGYYDSFGRWHPGYPWHPAYPAYPPVVSPLVFPQENPETLREVKELKRELAKLSTQIAELSAGKRGDLSIRERAALELLTSIDPTDTELLTRTLKAVKLLLGPEVTK